MITHVVGFRPPDDKWDSMLRVYESCKDAGVSLPQEVLDFFDGKSPSGEPGMEIDLGDAVSRHEEETREVYEIDVTKLPKDVKIVRVYDSD